MFNELYVNSPLQLKNSKTKIMHELDQALAEQAPNNADVTYELPPLALDGIPTPVDKMTQVQLVLSRFIHVKSYACIGKKF